MKNILVIFGGVSTEHEISQKSAYNIIRGLRQAERQVRIIGMDRRGRLLPFRCPDEAVLAENWEELALAALRELAQEDLLLNFQAGLSLKDFLERLAGGTVDVIFPAVHGVNCEDGVLQGLLELSDLPYVGSPVLSSAICMDKIITKRLLFHAQIPLLPWVSSSRSQIALNIQEEISYIADELGFPCFVKPSNGGSSIGTAKAIDEESLGRALKQAAAFDNDVLIEAFVDGRELEVAVMGNETPFAAVVGEVAVQSEDAYYDYQTKYFHADAARVIIPAEIDEEESNQIRSMAVTIYKTFNCRGMARVDFFKDRRSGKLLFNEINTLPGFTAISVFPQAFAHVGIALPELLLRLCHLAVEEYNNKKRSTEVGEIHERN